MKTFTGFVRSFLLTGLMIVSLMGISEAKQLPEVDWANEIYTMNIPDSAKNAAQRRSYQLLNAGTPEANKENKQKIIDAINEKIKAQESQLPFKLKTVQNVEVDKNADLTLEAGEVPMAIIPIVVADFAIPIKYTIQGTNYFEYQIVSAIDIAFCSEDNDGALTILGTIPLHFYKEYPGTQDLSEMKFLDQAAQARIYADFTAEMISKHLDFTKYKKMISGLVDKKFAPETYRVDRVDYSSEKAKKMFTAMLNRRITANIFTSEFAAATGNVVYPSLLSGDWAENPSNGLYALQMTSSHAGEKTVQMAKTVDHSIVLDVTGMGDKEVETKQTSEINGFKAYKVWLECNIANYNPAKTEVTNDIVEEYLKDTSSGSAIVKDPVEIYSALIVGAAVKSAEQYGGKKSKK